MLHDIFKKSNVLIIVDSDTNNSQLFCYLEELISEAEYRTIAILCEYDESLNDKLINMATHIRVHFYPSRLKAECNDYSVNKTYELIYKILDDEIITNFFEICGYPTNDIIRWICYFNANYYYNVYLRIDEICKNEDIDLIIDFSSEEYKLSEVYDFHTDHECRLLFGKRSFSWKIYFRTMKNIFLLRFFRDLFSCLFSSIFKGSHLDIQDNNKSDVFIFVGGLTHALDAIPVIKELERKNITSCVVSYGHGLIRAQCIAQEKLERSKIPVEILQRHIGINEIYKSFGFYLRLLKNRREISNRIKKYVELPPRLLKQITNRLMVQAYESSNHVLAWDKILRNCDPGVLMVFNNLMIHERSLIVAARKRRKCIVEITHGIVEHSNILRNDLFPDIILTVYENLKELFNGKATDSPPYISNVGQPRFDKLFRDRKNISIISQKKKLGFDSRHPVFLIVSGRQIDKQYLIELISVLQGIVNESNDIQIIWKFHPEIRKELLHSYKDWFLPKLEQIKNKVVWTNEYEIGDLLLCSDLVIMDFVSTSISEALVCDKPVIFYDRRNTSQTSFHNFSDVIFTVRDKQQCKDAILKALDTPSAKKLFPDVDEFMKKYTGVDEFAAKRAADEIERILTKTSEMRL